MRGRNNNGLLKGGCRKKRRGEEKGKASRKESGENTEKEKTGGERTRIKEKGEIGNNKKKRKG